MLRKIKKGSIYILLDLIGSAAYGVVLYFIFTWLAGYSLLYAYFGNLILIILLLALEEYFIRLVDSREIYEELRKRKDGEKYYRTLQKTLNNNIPTKTMLYLFYVIVLVFSRIIDFYPALVSEDLSNFIHENSYSILLLIALDGVTQQFSKDRERMRKLSANLEKAFTESQD